MGKKLKLVTEKDKDGNILIAVKGKKPRLANMKEFISNLTDDEINEVDKELTKWAKLWPKKEVK